MKAHKVISNRYLRFVLFMGLGVIRFINDLLIFSVIFSIFLIILK